MPWHRRVMVLGVKYWYGTVLWMVRFDEVGLLDFLVDVVDLDGLVGDVL